MKPTPKDGPNLRHDRRNLVFGVPDSTDTNVSVQSKKQARSLKFQINEEEIMYYLSSKNKGADQLC